MLGTWSGEQIHRGLPWAIESALPSPQPSALPSYSSHCLQSQAGRPTQNTASRPTTPRYQDLGLPWPGTPPPPAPCGPFAWLLRNMDCARCWLSPRPTLCRGCSLAPLWLELRWGKGGAGQTGLPRAVTFQGGDLWRALGSKLELHTRPMAKGWSSRQEGRTCFI